MKILRDSCNESSFHLDFDETGFDSNSAKIGGGGGLGGAAPLGPSGVIGPGHYKTIEMINLTSKESRVSFSVKTTEKEVKTKKTIGRALPIVF